MEGLKVSTEIKERRCLKMSTLQYVQPTDEQKEVMQPMEGVYENRS